MSGGTAHAISQSDQAIMKDFAIIGGAFCVLGLLGLGVIKMFFNPARETIPTEPEESKQSLGY